MVAIRQRLHLAGGQRNGPRAVAPYRGGMIFPVERYRHNLAGFRIGFTGERQRLVVLSRVDDVVLRNRINRKRWRVGIHTYRLAAAHGIARGVFTADVHGPGAVTQRLCIRGWHVHTPCAAGPHFRRVGFTVQRDGKPGSLRQIFAGAGQRKASGVFAGIDHVVTGRCPQRDAGVSGRDCDGNAARLRRFAPVDLHDRPGMFAVSLSREFYGPGTLFPDHGAGNGASAAVFNLNGRARLPGTAKGWGVVVRDRFSTQHTLLITRVVRQQKGRRRAFNIFGVVDDFGFGFAVTPVRQQCANGTAAQRSACNPSPWRVIENASLLKERLNAGNRRSLRG